MTNWISAFLRQPGAILKTPDDLVTVCEKGILGDANQDPFSAIRWVFRRFEPDLKPERSWQTSDERR